jgi:hypothetical protein
VARRLAALGAELDEVTGLEQERGFRFNLDGQTVDVLGPDGLAAPPRTKGRLQTIQVPGGTQALKRTEAVELVVADQHAVLRRPTLLGAVLLKARSLPVHDRPEDQRQDLITLLGLVTDPRPVAATLTRAEAKWLQAIESRLDLEDADLDATVDPAHLQIARAAYRRLTGAR